MTIDKALNILALVSLIEMMIYIGLGTSVSDVMSAVKNWSLMARGILVNYILFPLVTIVLLMLFDAHPLVAVGFMILAVCPAGAYGAPYTAIAKGNLGAAAGLMIVLSGLSPLLSPSLLNVLVPWVTGSALLEVNATQIAITLLLGQVLPLLAGLGVNQFRPQLAARLLGPAETATKILNALFLLLVAYFQFQSFLAIKLAGFFGMLTLLVASVALGWLTGGPGGEGRRAMAMTTAVRNSGVAMVIATGSFPGTPVVTATMVYGAIGGVGALFFALWWGRRVSRELAIAPGRQT